MPKETDRTMLNLAALRTNLKVMMDPKILEKFAELLVALGDDSGDYLSRYEFFVRKNGRECRYAQMAKEFFLNDYGQSCADAINWLYHNWSKYYE